MPPLSELDIEPGNPIAGEAVSAIQGWAIIEDDDEVVEALRLDAADEMAALLAGTRLSSGCDEEDEDEDGFIRRRWRSEHGARAPCSTGLW